MFHFEMFPHWDETFEVLHSDIDQNLIAFPCYFHHLEENFC